jgi:hypothetical protein
MTYDYTTEDYSHASELAKLEIGCEGSVFSRLLLHLFLSADFAVRTAQVMARLQRTPCPQVTSLASAILLRLTAMELFYRHALYCSTHISPILSVLVRAVGLWLKFLLAKTRIFVAVEKHC